MHLLSCRQDDHLQKYCAVQPAYVIALLLLPMLMWHLLLFSSSSCGRRFILSSGCDTLFCYSRS
jgi:hypothetical protein